MMRNVISENLRGLLRSFLYAFQGLWRALMRERNLRIHLVCALYVLFFSSFFHLTAGERALLFLTILLVLAAELMNTALEEAVNLFSREVSPGAKLAKDAAAAAVLLTALGAVAVGIFLFGDLAVWRQAFAFFAGRLWRLAALLVSFAAAFFFVFGTKYPK